MKVEVLKSLHIMKFALKNRTVFLCLAFLCLAILSCVWYFNRSFAPLVRNSSPFKSDITPLLIGEWKVKASHESWMDRNDIKAYQKKNDLTSYFLFKPDGTYESMSWDNAFSTAASRTLEKGRYRVSGQTITLRDFKMFSRPNRRDEGLDTDATSTPCTDSIGCAGEWEAHNGYIQMAKEGVSHRIVRANWEKKYFVTEPIFDPGDGLLRSKQASWIKEKVSP